MSLIELALQRVKADEAATKRGKTETAAPASGAAPTRAEVAAGAIPVPDVPLNPDILIDDEFLRETGLAAPESHEHQQRAEYRHIKYGLLRGTNESGNLILITSALEGEGKSFTSLHLALSLASEQDYSVVLVDADVIRPTLTRMLGNEGRRGLMDAVVDASVNVESLMLSTNIRGLSFLPAGRPDDRATEHFASARMGEVMGRILAVPNRIVVVDTLPLLLTTEARALTALGGQVVLVVRAESTPQAAVLEAIELLGEGANVKLLLNAAVRSKALGYYGGGYGYTYQPIDKKKEKA